MENKKAMQERIEKLRTRNTNNRRLAKVETEFVTERAGAYEIEVYIEGPDGYDGIFAFVHIDYQSNILYATVHELGQFPFQTWVKLTKNNSILVEETHYDTTDWWLGDIPATTSDVIRFEFEVLNLTDGVIYQGKILVSRGIGSGYITKIN